ncbi:hypothetical protein AAMO2058_001420100 [Amorphochlora amoebiformis]
MDAVLELVDPRKASREQCRCSKSKYKQTDSPSGTDVIETCKRRMHTTKPSSKQNCKRFRQRSQRRTRGHVLPALVVHFPLCHRPGWRRDDLATKNPEHSIAARGYRVINPSRRISWKTPMSDVVKSIKGYYRSEVKQLSVTIIYISHGLPGWLFGGEKNALSEVDGIEKFARFILDFSEALSTKIRAVLLNACHSSTELFDAATGAYFCSPARLLSVVLSGVQVVGFAGSHIDAGIGSLHRPLSNASRGSRGGREFKSGGMAMAAILGRNVSIVGRSPVEFGIEKLPTRVPLEDGAVVYVDGKVQQGPKSALYHPCALTKWVRLACGLPYKRGWFLPACDARSRARLRRRRVSAEGKSHVNGYIGRETDGTSEGILGDFMYAEAESRRRKLSLEACDSRRNVPSLEVDGRTHTGL